MMISRGFSVRFVAEVADAGKAGIGGDSFGGPGLSDRV
jgi:hypothetical protein